MMPDRNRRMRLVAGLLAWVALVVAPQGTPVDADVLYQWTDENGIRHFSNTRPPKGSGATVLMDEIPYDPETEARRRAQEAEMLEERKAAELEERLEKAEREAETARREAEAARRRAEQVQETAERDEADRSYDIYVPWPRHPGYGRPGHGSPGHRPPGGRPSGDRRPEDRPSWYPPYDPFPTYPDKPWQQPRQEPERDPRHGDGRGKPPR